MTEVEIKLAVTSVDRDVRLLHALGATLVHPRAYEENVLLDLPGMPLSRRGAMLRVRRFAAMGTLTYKEPAPGPPGYVEEGSPGNLPPPAQGFPQCSPPRISATLEALSREGVLAPSPTGSSERTRKKYKVRRELEVNVSDPGITIHMLELAGFQAIWKYAKFRTVYAVEGAHVMIDETPIGDFLELEGPEEKIDDVASRLGRAASDYIQETYRGLHEQWCRERGLTQGDLLFPEGVSQ